MRIMRFFPIFNPPNPPLFLPPFRDNENEDEEEIPKTWDEAEKAQKKHNKKAWASLIIFIVFVVILLYYFRI